MLPLTLLAARKLVTLLTTDDLLAQTIRQPTAGPQLTRSP